jgi:hypothetical protein
MPTDGDRRIAAEVDEFMALIKAAPEGSFGGRAFSIESYVDQCHKVRRLGWSRERWLDTLGEKLALPAETLAEMRAHWDIEAERALIPAESKDAP